MPSIFLFPWFISFGNGRQFGRTDENVDISGEDGQRYANDGEMKEQFVKQLVIVPSREIDSDLVDVITVSSVSKFMTASTTGLFWGLKSNGSKLNARDNMAYI